MLGLGLAGCGDAGTGIDELPGYEVAGTVRTARGEAVAGALVEVHLYGPAGCGSAPLLAYSSARADRDGRYRVLRQDLSGRLNGCLRLLAHPDGSALSPPSAKADVPVDSAQVEDGRTVFTVDLTVP